MSNQQGWSARDITPGQYRVVRRRNNPDDDQWPEADTVLLIMNRTPGGDWCVKDLAGRQWPDCTTYFLAKSTRPFWATFTLQLEYYDQPKYNNKVWSSLQLDRDGDFAYVSGNMLDLRANVERCLDPCRLVPGDLPDEV